MLELVQEFSSDPLDSEDMAVVICLRLRKFRGKLSSGCWCRCSDPVLTNVSYHMEKHWRFEVFDDFKKGILPKY